MPCTLRTPHVSGTAAFRDGHKCERRSSLMLWHAFSAVRPGRCQIAPFDAIQVITAVIANR